jgi:hypothetical protein
MGYVLRFGCGALGILLICLEEAYIVRCSGYMLGGRRAEGCDGRVFVFVVVLFLLLFFQYLHKNNQDIEAGHLLLLLTGCCCCC